MSPHRTALLALACLLAGSANAAAEHDFDWEFGCWKTEIKRLVHPLSGSQEWAEYEGTSYVRKVMGGRANLVELDVQGPAGRIEGMSLRLYNPEARQWSLNYSTIKGGTLWQPAIGEFKDGKGAFNDQESFHGRAVLVRMIVTDYSEKSAHFEQSFSDDGGKTWEVNWIAQDTRLKSAPACQGD